MTNRLASSTSPYLLQHAENPVDWQEWGDAAFAEARERDVPILLSVGYAACHWCHVMAHDSFEDDGVAAVVNRDFVAVKVDREERPDVDAVYMNATVAMNGSGGWPMTAFLAHDGAPFFAGTFYPRVQFLQLLDAVTDAWTERRDQVADAGAQLTQVLASRQTLPTATDPLTADDLAGAVTALTSTFDDVRGGFGRAPKFPPSMVLEFLLRHHERTGDGAAKQMAVQTLSAMRRGGLHDQLAGGFARYSVDAAWVVPHFEKMLYDNALLLRAYTHAARLFAGTADGDEFAAVARSTAAFLLRDMRTEEGAFASALDADTDGEEGLTYVWTPAQLVDVLGPDDGAAAAAALEVTAEGTFEHGASTLQMLHDAPEAWPTWRDALLAAREQRPQPARDDKIVTAWNGLAIGALTEAGVVLDEPAFVAAARQAARHVVSTHLVGEGRGRLRRSSRAGAVGAAAGVAEDHGDLADGLFLLHQATNEPVWAEVAEHLVDLALEHFLDDDGGFFDTADDAETLIARPKDTSDNAAPCGTTAVAGALLTSAALSGSLDRRAAAQAAVQSMAALVGIDPRFGGWLLAVAEGLVAGPVEVAVVGADDDPAAAELGLAVWRHRPPGAVVVTGEPGDARPLLADRPLVGGKPAAYVCRGFVCDAPVTTVDDLLTALRR